MCYKVEFEKYLTRNFQRKTFLTSNSTLEIEYIPYSIKTDKIYVGVIVIYKYLCIKLVVVCNKDTHKLFFRYYYTRLT